jgi:pSer/pThr/pTyr-binding forkhead associated (FHA) protein
MPQNFQFIVQTGPEPGKVISLNRSELVIGRDANADIPLPDAEVSRRHARVYLQGNGYWIEDLGSTNGTFVNDRRLVGPHALADGENLALGNNVTLLFQVVPIDPNATVLSTGSKPLPAGSPPGLAVPPASYPAEIQEEEAFIPEIEEFPDRIEDLSTPKKSGPSSGQMWMIAGGGCLVILLCTLVAGAIAFDQLNMYCKEPFDVIFRALGFCP